MTTTWTGSPVLSAASINELRTAVYEAGGSPPDWTDGAQLPASATLKAVYATEIHEAIQRLWDDKGLGLVPAWSIGTPPGAPTRIPQFPSIQSDDITDLRRWFNHYETWGDLRGVHWFNSSRTDFPTVGWNVETVIGVSKDGTYNSGDVSAVHRHCENARNYGLVNIVRLDWKAGHAVPIDTNECETWKTYFNQAVNALKDVATIFIVGNEPTIEPPGEPNHGITSSQYADAFNCLYADKVAGTMYLAAGPAACSLSTPVGGDEEIDTAWLKRASDEITALDGWALHTYGAPYLNYAGGDRRVLCNHPSLICDIKRDPHRNTRLEGDAGFRRFRDYIEQIAGKWWAKPVYITETNTQGYNAKYYDPDFDPDDPEVTGPPTENYIAGWNQRAYQEIRSYNRETNSSRDRNPRILSLCWFVDDYRGDDNWKEHALSNGAAYPILQQARNDFKASDTSTGITIPWRGAIVTGDDRYQDLRSAEGVTIRLGTLV